MPTPDLLRLRILRIFLMLSNGSLEYMLGMWVLSVLGMLLLLLMVLGRLVLCGSLLLSSLLRRLSSLLRSVLSSGLLLGVLNGSLGEKGVSQKLYRKRSRGTNLQ